MRVFEISFRKLTAWLRADQLGERKKEQTVAEAIPKHDPAQTVPTPKSPIPDFAAFRKAIFGNRKLPGSGLLRQDRERY